MPSGLDICTQALTEVGAITPGQTAQQEHQDWAFLKLNRLFKDWTGRWGLFAWGWKGYRFPLIANQGEYTMGPGVGADFDMPRPEGTQPGRGVLRASLIVNVGPNETRKPLQILTPDEWERVLSRTQTSAEPESVYNNGRAPKSLVYFDPIPSQANDVEFQIPSPIETLADIGDDVDMPESYHDAVVWTLAENLNLKGYPTPATVIRMAAEKRAGIVANNSAPGRLISDAPRSGRLTSSLSEFMNGGW